MKKGEKFDEGNVGDEVRQLKLFFVAFGVKVWYNGFALHFVQTT